MTPQFALLEIFSWWAKLSAAQQFFYGIGIAAGVVTLVLAVLTIFGLGDHDGDVTGHDGDGGAEHGDGSSLLSVKPITGFFLGFGWSGGIALDNGLSVTVSALIALGVGGVMMVALAALIRAIYSLRTDGTRKINDAVGAIGTVYVTLPPSRGAGGQINVTVSGRLETMPALNAALRAIPSGEKVKVVGVVDAGTLLVEPLA